MFTLDTNHPAVAYISPDFTHQLRADNNFPFVSYDGEGEIRVEGSCVAMVYEESCSKADELNTTLTIRLQPDGVDLLVVRPEVRVA